MDESKRKQLYVCILTGATYGAYEHFRKLSTFIAPHWINLKCNVFTIKKATHFLANYTPRVYKISVYRTSATYNM